MINQRRLQHLWLRHPLQQIPKQDKGKLSTAPEGDVVYPRTEMKISALLKGSRPFPPIMQNPAGSSHFTPAAQGSVAGEQSRGDDGDDLCSDRSSPVRNFHRPEQQEPVWKHLCHGIRAVTCTMSRQPHGLWGVDAGGATADPPEKTKRNWLSGSPSPESDHPATELPEATLRFSEATSAAGKPMTTPFLISSLDSLGQWLSVLQVKGFKLHDSTVTAQRSQLNSHGSVARGPSGQP